MVHILTDISNTLIFYFKLVLTKDVNNRLVNGNGKWLDSNSSFIIESVLTDDKNCNFFPKLSLLII
jgi:hypothetical protein